MKLEHDYTPWEVEREVAGFVEDYNPRRDHEALQNGTPTDAFFGGQATILARIKQRTLQRRKRENLHVAHHAAIYSEVSLRNALNCLVWPGDVQCRLSFSTGTKRRAGQFRTEVIVRRYLPIAARKPGSGVFRSEP